jgi:hypothetical protein
LSIPECGHCHRIIGCNLLANLIIGFHVFDMRFPAQPLPLSSTIELEEHIVVSEDMSEVDLEASDGGAAWGWSSYIEYH